jgi:hypothetical protein
LYRGKPVRAAFTANVYVGCYNKRIRASHRGRRRAKTNICAPAKPRLKIIVIRHTAGGHRRRGNGNQRKKTVIFTAVKHHHKKITMKQ